MRSSPPILGVALLFSAGVVVSAGEPGGAAALLALAFLLRARVPRPLARRGGLAVPALATALVAAGVLHGHTAGGVALTGAPAPVEAPDSTAGVTEGAEALRLRLRAAALARVRATFSREAPLAEALLLAERSSLEPELRRAFTRSGAAHLLAISGFHVGVLAGWVLLVLRGSGLSRARAATGAAAAVWGYVFVLGFPTSAVRAALILTAAAAGRIRGRPVHRLGAWSLALLLLVAADPGTVQRAGAQLSFAGALGLMLWADRWGDGLARWTARLTRREPGALPAWGTVATAAVAASLAAQVATLPLATWHFQRVAVTGLPATLAATPLVTLALPGALLALMAHGLSLPGAGLLAAGAEGLLWATRSVLVAFAALDPGWLLGPASVGTGTVAGVLAWRAGRRLGPGALRGWAAVAAVLAGVSWGPGVQGAVRSGLGGAAVDVRVLDVGQGDAIAVGTPGGRWILVDTGAGSGDRLARMLAAEGIRRLELLVLTHPDLDHMGAAAGLLEAFPVAAVADGGTVRGTGAFRALAEVAELRGLPWRRLSRGDAWSLDGVRFRVLHPGGPDDPGRGGEPNDRSVVLHVSWGDFDLLLTGDISVEVEEGLSPLLEPVEVLKVAHHGSRTSTGGPFLERVRPQAALVSAGRRNRFGHPAPVVLARLRRAGIPVYRTDTGGTLRLRARPDGSWRMEGSVAGRVGSPTPAGSSN